MKTFKKFLWVYIFMPTFLILSACDNDNNPLETYIMDTAPDYSNEDMWYHSDNQDKTADVDVFYVVPTCTFDHKNTAGEVVHFMDVYNKIQREAFITPAELAANLLAKECRFFSPYYRQISIQSWALGDEEINRCYSYAFQDVDKAFRYYMKYINNGRPFILAGHSQGGKSIIELLKKTLTPEQYKQMVVAYAFGFKLTDKDLKSPFVIPAKSSDDIGVLVSYNSLSNVNAVSPPLKGTVACINPINWVTDATYAPASQNKGSVFFNTDGTSDTTYNMVGAKIDMNIKCLLVDGYDDNECFVPVTEFLFPKGNYHTRELNLYYFNIQENLKLRIQKAAELRGR